jgi:hypothetical protein
MRILLIISCLFFSTLSISQPVLIPFKMGDKFGLSDEKGNMIVQPGYDNIDYLKENYFQFLNHTIIRDSVRSFNGEIKIVEKDRPLFGLFYKDKVLIPAQQFRHFLIYRNCIISSQNPYHPEDCALYNLKGEKILADPVKAIGVNDNRDFGNLVKLTEKLTLLAIFERDENRKRIFSIAVYDNEKQKINGWLLKKVSNFSIDKSQMGYTHVLCRYDDANGHQEKYLRFNNNDFQLIAKSELSAKDEAELKNSGHFFNEKYPREVSIGSAGDDMVMVPATEDLQPMPAYKEADQEKNSFYEVIKDSLFYIDGRSKIYTKIPVGAEIIFFVKNYYSQSQPVIFRQSKKFGLLIKGATTRMMYDSLVYFGNYFIAGKTIAGSLKFGILNKEGIESVPFIYDSIAGDMQQFNFEHAGAFNGNKQNFVLKPRAGYYSIANKNPYTKGPTDNILVYKNGKAGIINATNEILIPIIYDLVAQNGISYTGSRESDFILLKKNGFYTVANLAFNFKLRKYELADTIPASFKNIPCFYINNFYNKKGLKLYGLYDDEFHFVGYANENGFLYFKK